MFQAGGLVVVLVEVSRKPYLASIVPVIVNAILNEHQIIVDIVAFVNKGDFPRSRLGEKQRGKILAGWVTRKLRTLAQFAIRDLDPAAMGEGGGGGGGDPNRHSTASIRSGIPTVGSSTLKNVENAPQIMEQEEFQRQMDRMAGEHNGTGYGVALSGPADYEQFDDRRRPSRDESTPKIRLPGVDGREGMDMWSGDDGAEYFPGTATMHSNLADTNHK